MPRNKWHPDTSNLPLSYPARSPASMSAKRRYCPNEAYISPLWNPIFQVRSSGNNLPVVQYTLQILLSAICPYLSGQCPESHMFSSHFPISARSCHQAYNPSPDIPPLMQSDQSHHRIHHPCLHPTLLPHSVQAQFRSHRHPAFLRPDTMHIPDTRPLRIQSRSHGPPVMHCLYISHLFPTVQRSAPPTFPAGNPL